MFADRATISIRSGKGGDGHVSFRRELYVPNGGPDGGDGGRGGDVIFEVDEGLNTLQDYRHRRKYAAKDGEPGGKKRCHGKDADDIVLKVPEGTVIKEAESGKVIADMSGDNRRQVILKGGKGGLGNQHFATATMQIPKYAQPGQPAKELMVKLELKVIADVGLVGFPNVGKSTLLSRVTNAQPKIANYHFTTLNPNLGVVDLEGANGFIIADIPGLIEGASEGIGLGHEFLRHIERTKMMPCSDMVDRMYKELKEEMGLKRDEIAVLVNGLGSTPLLELNLVFYELHKRMHKDGLKIYDTEIKTYCTCMEMGGFSITFLKLDDELKPYYDAPCYYSVLCERFCIRRSKSRMMVRTRKSKFDENDVKAS